MKLVAYVKFAALIVVGCFVATITTPQYRSTVVRVGLFALAATLAIALIDLTRRAAPPPEPSPFEPRRQRAPRPGWPTELERIVVEVRAMEAGAERNAGVVPPALRRSCRRVAAGRLADRHGVDLDLDPIRAASVCGPDLWAALDGQPTTLDSGGLVSALEGL
jgi:hypothetical protein